MQRTQKRRRSVRRRLRAASTLPLASLLQLAPLFVDGALELVKQLLVVLGDLVHQERDRRPTRIAEQDLQPLRDLRALEFILALDGPISKRPAFRRTLEQSFL